MCTICSRGLTEERPPRNQTRGSIGLRGTVIARTQVENDGKPASAHHESDGQGQQTERGSVARYVPRAGCGLADGLPPRHSETQLYPPLIYVGDG